MHIYSKVSSVCNYSRIGMSSWVFLVNIIFSTRSLSHFPQKFLAIIISFYLYMYPYGALDVSLNVCKFFASLFS